MKLEAISRGPRSATIGGLPTLHSTTFMSAQLGAWKLPMLVVALDALEELGRPA